MRTLTVFPLPKIPFVAHGTETMAINSGTLGPDSCCGNPNVPTATLCCQQVRYDHNVNPKISAQPISGGRPCDFERVYSLSSIDLRVHPIEQQRASSPKGSMNETHTPCSTSYSILPQMVLRSFPSGGPTMAAGSDVPAYIHCIPCVYACSGHCDLTS